MWREIIAPCFMAARSTLPRLLLVLVVLARISGGAVVFADEGVVSRYDISSGPADQGLIELARQTKGKNLSVLIRSGQFARFTTNAVHGQYRPDEALSVLLRDTGLTGSIGATGIVAVSIVGEQNMPSKQTHLTWGTLFGIIGAHLFSPIAAAQEAPPAAQTTPELQEVVVTGSRLGANFVAPTPVTTVSAEQLSQVSPNDIATGLAQIPALNDSVLSSQAATASAATGTNGQSLLNLRGLGVNRTLVLLDGQRLGTTNVADSVDINMIPQSLLKSVDIVTGGASASYGSDAVAGVVNFILDTRFQGLKADVSAGTTTYGDATNGNVELAFGKAFSDSLRLIVGANFFKEGGIGILDTGRDWHDDPTVAYPNPVGGTLPSTIVEPDARASNGTYGGLITGVQGCATAACKALVGQQFGAGGVLEPFAVGADAGSTFASGGEGATVNYGLSPEIDRENLLMHSEWDANSNLTFFTEGIFARTKTDYEGQYSSMTSTTQYTIFPNNAFLPPALQNFFAANPTAASFTLGRVDTDLGPQDVDTLTEVGRFSVGAKGTINDRWSFDASLGEQYTINDLDVLEPIDRNTYAAVNAVINPATGKAACASTLLGLDPTCVPANLFGPGAIGAAAANYIDGDNRGDTVFRQTSFESNLRGDLGDNITLGAGPISVATGLDFRHDIADRHVDELSDTDISCTDVAGCPKAYAGRYGAYYFYNPTPFYGWTSATEGYAEIGVPLLKNVPGAKSLSLDLAGRVTDYNLSGFQDSWKLGMQWAQNDSFMIRSTASQDIRAPDVLELFNPGSVTLASDIFPSSSANPQYQVGGLNLAKGNTALQPEIAHTDTAGIVFTPTFLEGFQTSVDYYKIEIAHAIEQLTFQGIIDGCAAGNKTYCGLISLDGVPVTTTGGIVTTTTGLLVTEPTENVGSEKVAGLDWESDYTHHFLGGTFSSRLVANYLLEENLPSAITGCTHTNLIGAIGGCLGANGYPRWRGTVSAQYAIGRVSGLVQERLIDSGRADPWDVVGTTITSNAVPMIEYTDLNLSYIMGFHDRGRIYLSVTNLFNRDPPVTITVAHQSVDPTSFDVYDVLGRRFVLGYRLTF